MDVTPEMRDTILRYERVRQELSPQIQKLEATIAFIQELPDDANLDEVKDYLRSSDGLGISLYNRINVEPASTIAQLKQLLVPYLEGELQ